MVDEESGGLPFGDVRAYRLQDAPAFKIAPHLLGFLLQALRQPCNLVVELRIGRVDALLRRDGAQCEVGAHGSIRGLAYLLHERLLLRARRGKVLLERHALALESM